jgi:hypothetical protein
MSVVVPSSDVAVWIEFMLYNISNCTIDEIRIKAYLEIAGRAVERCDIAEEMSVVV